MKRLALMVLLAGCGPDHSIDFTGTYSGTVNRSGTCGTGPQPTTLKLARQGDLLVLDWCGGALADYSGNQAKPRKTMCPLVAGQRAPDVLAGGVLELNGFDLVVNASFDVGGPPACRAEYAGTLKRN